MGYGSKIKNPDKSIFNKSSDSDVEQSLDRISVPTPVRTNYINADNYRPDDINFAQHSFGNIATLRLLNHPDSIQPKLYSGHETNNHEQEADDFARQVTTGGEISAAFTHAQPGIQRSPEEDESTAGSSIDVTTEPNADVSTFPSFLVDDSTAEIGPGQMRKSEFLSQLRTSVCTTAESALSGTLWSTVGCPWIDHWFSYYSNRDASSIERSIRRYLPGASTVTTAAEYIPLICNRVRNSINTWVSTGEVTGIPEGAAENIPGLGVLSTVRGLGSGLLRRAGNFISGILFKGRDGGARGNVDPQNIKSQLGSGNPLTGGLRSRLDKIYGTDFSHVRVHTDNTASRLSKNLNAKAFTIGRDIAFGAGEYQPGTIVGDALIAHELAHVVQQGGDSVSTPMQKSNTSTGTFENEADMSAMAAIAQIWGGVNQGVKAIGSRAIPSLRSGIQLQRCESCNEEQTTTPTSEQIHTPEESTTPSNATITADDVIWSEDDSSCPVINQPGQQIIPVNVVFSMSEEDAQAFGWEAAIGRSVSLTGARSAGYIISPPVRNFYDPFLPLSTRLQGGTGSLGELGGTYGAERYVSSQIMRDLRPRILTEGSELALREFTGSSEWLTRYNIRGRDLDRLPSLIVRMSEGGTLSAAEQSLVQTFFRAHAENGLTFASPAMSATIEPGLSSASHAAPFLREYPYVVRIEVPSSAVGEVNSVLGTARPANLVNEMEVLVFTDSRGNITNIRPNPTSSLGRAAPYLRWGGRALIVVGAGVTAYRVGTATPEERPRVIGEEAGGWIGGFGGAGLATAGCIALGIATEGVVLIICGLVGGLGGGIGMSALGGEIGEAAGPDPIARVGSYMINSYTDRMMESEDPVVRQDAVAIRRVVYHDDSLSVMYLFNRICGGCMNFGW